MTDIKAALTDLLTSDEALEAVVDRHFTPGYRQRTNGVWDDRVGFVEHIAHLRSIVADVDIDVLDELRHGQRYADRHVVTVTKRDGSTVVQEVYVFAEIDQSERFARLEEITLMLHGAEADRDLGSAR